MPGTVAHPPVTQTQLAAIIGVTTDTVRSWERAGCPVERPGRKGLASQYIPADVIRWKEERAVQAATGDLAATDMSELRRRKLATEVAMAETTLMEKQKQLVPAALAIEKVTDMLAGLRSRLLVIPSIVAPRLTLARNQAEMFQIVQDALYEAMRAISSNPAAFMAEAKQTREVAGK